MRWYVFWLCIAVLGVILNTVALILNGKWESVVGLALSFGSGAFFLAMIQNEREVRRALR